MPEPCLHETHLEHLCVQEVLCKYICYSIVLRNFRGFKACLCKQVDLETKDSIFYVLIRREGSHGTYETMKR